MSSKQGQRVPSWTLLKYIPITLSPISASRTVLRLPICGYVSSLFQCSQHALCDKLAVTLQLPLAFSVSACGCCFPFIRQRSSLYLFDLNASPAAPHLVDTDRWRRVPSQPPQAASLCYFMCSALSILPFCVTTSMGKDAYWLF